jgi:hypothetical protein
VLTSLRHRYYSVGTSHRLSPQDLVSGGVKTGFSPDAGPAFCAAAFKGLAAVVAAMAKQGKLPILSIKGDETNTSAFSMEKYTQLVAPGGLGGNVMAYFEYWAQWPGQPRNEAMLQYAMRWGEAGVPMQMHSARPEGTTQPFLCGVGGGTRAENASATGNFSLGMFLLAANEQSFYSTGSGWNGGLEQAVWLPEYDRPLGAPHGPATEVAPHTYQRTFEHVRVRVNMSDCASSLVTWGGAHV